MAKVKGVIVEPRRNTLYTFTEVASKGQYFYFFLRRDGRLVAVFVFWVGLI